MNRRGFFGALASVCGAAAGAAVAIALPAPKPQPPIFTISGLRTTRWRNYAGKYKQLSHGEMVALMDEQFFRKPMPGSPYGLHYWLTKR